MEEYSKLLTAIASLLWPIFAFVVLFMFKDKIGDVIGRLKKGKLLGQELELNDSLNSLQESASNLSEEVALIPSIESTSPNSENTESICTSEEDCGIKNIIHEAVRSPKAALVLLALEIGKESKQTLASIGKLKGRKHMPITQAIDELDSHYGLPKHISSSLRLFWETRNKIIHGDETNERNILSAIDSGVTILESHLLRN